MVEESGAADCEHTLLYSIENSLRRLHANNSKQANISDYLELELYITLCDKVKMYF
jgi:hypothetical protein